MRPSHLVCDSEIWWAEQLSANSRRLFASKVHSLEGIESAADISVKVHLKESGSWHGWRVVEGKVSLGELTEVAAVHIPILTTTSLTFPDPRRISLIARKLHTASDPLSRYSRCDLARCVYVDCRGIFRGRGPESQPICGSPASLNRRSRVDHLPLARRTSLQTEERLVIL